MNLATQTLIERLAAGRPARLPASAWRRAAKHLPPELLARVEVIEPCCEGGWLELRPRSEVPA